MDKVGRVFAFPKYKPLGLPNRISQEFSNVVNIWQKIMTSKSLQTHLYLTHPFRDNLDVLSVAHFTKSEKKILH